MLRLPISLCLLCALIAGELGAQVPEIEDDFESVDPCTNDSGWVCQGTTRWIAPDAPDCADDPTNPDCNLLSPGEGYVRLTPDTGSQNGNVFRTEKIQWSNFRLVAEVEMLTTQGSPADGMAIVIVGSDGVPGLGHDGGGMGATGHGSFPTFIFEFDDYGNGGPDRDSDNHVGFSYSPTGFESTDQLSSDAFAEVPVPLCNSGRFLIEVQVQDGTVTCDLTNDQAQLQKTRMYEYTIPDFEPFEGYLGITASTGGAMQNHILHSITIDVLGADVCLRPPAVLRRDISSPNGDLRGSILFQDGDAIEVTILLQDLRQGEAKCAAPEKLLLEEWTPPGWAVSGVSGGGIFDPGEGRISWALTGGALSEGSTVTYLLEAPDGADSPAVIKGSFSEDVEGASPYAVGGDTQLLKGTPAAPFDSCGGICYWNILGAYDNPAGLDGSEETLRRDYLTDGIVGETDFLWKPDATVDTDFGGAAASTRIDGGPAGRNPGGVPTVLGWKQEGSRVHLEDVYGGDQNDSMIYAQAYVINTTGADMPVVLGVSSDDSVQVLLNGEEVWINPAVRPGSEACSPQDKAPVTLLDGENSLILKIFEAGTDWDFSARFQDESGAPVTEGLELSLEPGGEIPQPVKFHRGDADQNASLELTDAVQILGYLFLGSTTRVPLCLDAADADGNKSIELTDAVRILGYLFLGTGTIAPPGPPPDPCGPDPGAVHLGCDTFAGC